MYAEALGVDPSLETLAQWVSWADSAHFQALNDTDAQYNLTQFWDGKAALDAATTSAHMADLVYLDGLAHNILGYILMKQLVAADPSAMADLTTQMQQSFAAAADDFTQTGHDQMASDASLRAGQAQTDSAQIATNYVDASLTTAIKDQYNKVLDATSSALSSASFLANPLVLLGLAALVGYLVIRGRR